MHTQAGATHRRDTRQLPALAASHASAELAVQLFINQVEGRYGIDTRGAFVPGRIPEPIKAAPYLAERQAERSTSSMGSPCAGVAGVGSNAPSKPSCPPIALKPTTATDSTWLGDVLSALLMAALLSFVLSFGTAGAL